MNSTAVGSSESDDGLAFEGGRLGMNLIGVVHIPLGDVMQLRTGLIYSQKGGSDSETEDGYTTDLTVKLDYLAIPIEAAFKLGNVFALSVETYIIGSHYGMGLINILDDDDDEVFEDDEIWINGGISFSFAFMFGS